MLNALIALSAVLISETSSWDPAAVNAVPIRASNPLFTPEEPTALVLALIGIGIIGAYVGVQRWLRPRRESTGASWPSAPAKGIAAEQRTRGAA